MSDTRQTDDVVAATAQIATANAKRYLTQLCKHFEHRRPVTYGDGAGEIAFQMGVCRLRAEAAVLTLHVASIDAAALPQLEDVVARHLIRFAFREDINVEWHPVVPPPTVGA